MKAFDYIIAGGGVAGLTLSYLLLAPEYRQKSVLLIDRQTKTDNDKTFCFWEKGENLFENLVSKTWPRAQVKGTEFNKSYDLAPYKYKMVRSADFYTFIYKQIADAPNFTVVQEEVQAIFDNGKVKTARQTYTGQYVFDSTLNYQTKRLYTPNTLLQHFKGLVIETKEPVFNADEVTYMDFSIPQEGDCRFGYILPFSENKALIEYTIFNQFLLDDSEYDKQLESYLRKLKITDYEVLETETGVIPMSDYPFSVKRSKQVFQIGIKGGFAKASTGYSFLRTQRILKKLAQNLKEGKSPNADLPLQKKRFKNYDATLLRVLASGQFTGEEIFTELFKKNGMHLMFKFLDEETTVAEELKIMSTTPIKSFAKAFVNSLAAKPKAQSKFLS
ncbi:lycopene cyclase family protein [Roseivirga pacifica]|uniref:lycopene cyclase family protein n=1 Tax=Roseivirga pacifica TaxID=1267423 RepID=UPI0020943DF1|nr:lycopene cyclase family protein [Roseivirga pacifica]MCO6357561.1 lycopene cyclase [Roseivirga pacifica]MCO6365814.1 lycopene cyclase [Roseivirga pacifica]MCO6371143.1 lycopene cyclase [Roseivirga pacifica]MCO6375686.1 lycopene cyclase [Roseivirga pacifica]MCO6378521.1 lycopene cyclase [Roseivirga pacifica]